MARNQPQPEADREEVLECVQQNCPHCNKRMRNKYDNYRTVRTLAGVIRLRLKIRRCYNGECERVGYVLRPEAEGFLGITAAGIWFGRDGTSRSVALSRTS